MTQLAMRDPNERSVLGNGDRVYPVSIGSKFHNAAASGRSIATLSCKVAPSAAIAIRPHLLQVSTAALGVARACETVGENLDALTALSRRSRWSPSTRGGLHRCALSTPDAIHAGARDRCPVTVARERERRGGFLIHG
jgi:hypothetical protein